MRRDCLKLRLSDPSPVSVNLSFHASDSDDESSDRGERHTRTGVEGISMIPTAISAAQVRKHNFR